MQTIALELIGKKIREERVKHGWTQKDLSEKLFVDTSTMSRMEKGKNILSFSNFADEIINQDWLNEIMNLVPKKDLNDKINQPKVDYYQYSYPHHSTLRT